MDEPTRKNPAELRSLPGQLLFDWGAAVDDAPATDQADNDGLPVAEGRTGRRGKARRAAKSKPALPDQRNRESVVAEQSASDTTRGSHSGAASEVAPNAPTKKTLRTESRSARMANRNTGKKKKMKKKTTKKAAKKAAPKKTRTRDKKSAAATVSGHTKKTAEKKTATRSTGSTVTKARTANTADASLSVPEGLAEKVDSIDLKWGAKLPVVGFGFWKVPLEETAEVCRKAIEVGYRHLDCACDYGNETEVGKGISQALKDGICEREDLWVTSKLWNTYHSPEHVRQACERSLNDLGLDYLDLYLIHFPIAQRFVPFEKRYPPGWFFDPDAANPVIEEAAVPIRETWEAMEELAKSGLVRNIGISNFNTALIRDLLSYARIRPSVLQVESHPYLTQEKLLRYCQQQRIAVTAFSPLGAQSYFDLKMARKSESVLRNPVVTKISKATGKTPAQVVLRWGVQRGTAVIPKTSQPARMIENLNIFDFQLTEQQMEDISSLNQNRRFNDPGDFGETAFNTFLPIYD